VIAADASQVVPELSKWAMLLTGAGTGTGTGAVAFGRRLDFLHLPRWGKFQLARDFSPALGGFRPPPARSRRYSHSIVAGGLCVRS
jgi:hypothetical protein